MDAEAFAFDVLHLGLHPPLASPILGCNEQSADLAPVHGVERPRRQHRQVEPGAPVAQPRRHPGHQVWPVVPPPAPVERGCELGNELAQQRVRPVEHHHGVVQPLQVPTARGLVDGLRADGVAEAGEGPEDDDVSVDVDAAVPIEQREAEEVGEVLPERDAPGADAAAMHRGEPRLGGGAAQEVGEARRGGGDSEAALQERPQPVHAALGIHGVGGNQEAGTTVPPEEALQDKELAAAKLLQRGEPCHEEAVRARGREELARARREPPRLWRAPEQELEEALVPLRGRLLAAASGLNSSSMSSRHRRRRWRRPGVVVEGLHGLVHGDTKVGTSTTGGCRIAPRRGRRRGMEGLQGLVHGYTKAVTATTAAGARRIAP